MGFGVEPQGGPGHQAQAVSLSSDRGGGRKLLGRDHEPEGATSALEDLPKGDVHGWRVGKDHHVLRCEESLKVQAAGRKGEPPARRNHHGLAIEGHRPEAFW